eukprot:scaffold113393_cov18-Prasinocladus_malaysianus.AAC.2
MQIKRATWRYDFGLSLTELLRKIEMLPDTPLMLAYSTWVFKSVPDRCWTVSVQVNVALAHRMAAVVCHLQVCTFERVILLQKRKAS